jgi:pimeloyl-ACP methyl ester carboxylesterase
VAQTLDRYVETDDSPRAEIREECFFFGSSSSNAALYGRTHLPTGRRRDIGVVMVSPLGRERLRVCREMANLGRHIARAGFPVFRLDYRGEGESGGTFEESTIRTRIEDTVDGANELRGRTGVKSVVLVGLHLGAVVAALSTRLSGADRLILCDPVWSPQAYARQLFRANVLQQSQYFGEIAVAESVLREQIDAGESMTVYGFPMAAPLIRDLETLDLEGPLREFAWSSAILYFAANNQAPHREILKMSEWLGGEGRCAVRAVPASFSWSTRKLWTPNLTVLNEAVVSWLQQSDERQLVGSPRTTPAYQPELVRVGSGA